MDANNKDKIKNEFDIIINNINERNKYNRQILKSLDIMDIQKIYFDIFSKSIRR